ncbi:MAG: hypothetical protein QOE89_4132, partial [Pseudonocardiales bacterium]|nr:hypothetical protein [Pseudonocardiales bacterium]
MFLQATLEALTYAGDIGVDVVNMSFFTDPWLYNCLNNPADPAPERSEQRAIREGSAEPDRASHSAARKVGLVRENRPFGP